MKLQVPLNSVSCNYEELRDMLVHNQEYTKFRLKGCACTQPGIREIQMAVFVQPGVKGKSEGCVSAHGVRSLG